MSTFASNTTVVAQTKGKSNSNISAVNPKMTEVASNMTSVSTIMNEFLKQKFKFIVGK